MRTDKGARKWNDMIENEMWNMRQKQNYLQERRKNKTEKNKLSKNFPITECDDGVFPHPPWQKKLMRFDVSVSALSRRAGLVERTIIAAIVDVMKLCRLRLPNSAAFGDDDWQILGSFSSTAGS